MMGMMTLVLLVVVVCWCGGLGGGVGDDDDAPAQRMGRCPMDDGSLVSISLMALTTQDSEFGDLMVQYDGEEVNFCDFR